MKEISISEEVRKAAGQLKVIQIECAVNNAPTSDALWAELEKEASEIATTYETPMIKDRQAIKATREAYKALGKEPNRYRPSAEALCRRIVSGKGIYRLTTLVDVINLISIHTGHSIGGFDADRIEGESLVLGAGKAGEVFHGIGRGELNIEHLPVYRDSVGGIGTPTSDEERTKLTEGTHRLLMLVNMYDGADNAAEIAALAENLLTRYAGASEFSWRAIE